MHSQCLIEWLLKVSKNSLERLRENCSCEICHTAYRVECGRIKTLDCKAESFADKKCVLGVMVLLAGAGLGVMATVVAIIVTIAGGQPFRLNSRVELNEGALPVLAIVLVAGLGLALYGLVNVFLDYLLHEEIKIFRVLEDAQLPSFEFEDE